MSTKRGDQRHRWRPESRRTTFYDKCGRCSSLSYVATPAKVRMYRREVDGAVIFVKTAPPCVSAALAEEPKP